MAAVPVCVAKGVAAVLVEVWSDVACPWCYVGKRRLEAALAEFEPRESVSVTWRSFELDPTTPRERGVDAATHLASKYGTSVEQARAMQERMAGIAAGDGLEMRPDLVRGGNTFDAHRLLHLAAEHGLGDAVKERFMRAYHVEGEPIGNADALERLAVEAGLDAAEVREVLTGDRFGAEVREDERLAAALGISAVPFFVVDRAFGAAGAQSPEILGELLRRARDAEPAAAPEPS
jgi:predicted DsbA family dithiol-disulfide isomerase